MSEPKDNLYLLPSCRSDVEGIPQAQKDLTHWMRTFASAAPKLDPNKFPAIVLHNDSGESWYYAKENDTIEALVQELLVDATALALGREGGMSFWTDAEGDDERSSEDLGRVHFTLTNWFPATEPSRPQSAALVNALTLQSLVEDLRRDNERLREELAALRKGTP
jgi:hypothetical protein